MIFLAVSRLQLITRWPQSKASHVTYRSFTFRLFLSQLAETGLCYNNWDGNGLWMLLYM